MSHEKIDSLNQESWARAQSDPKDALESSQKAVELSRSAGYRAGEATGLLNWGWALIYTADYEGAITRLHEARTIYEEINDTEGVLKALNALGVVAHRLGDSEQALERYQQTLDLARGSNNRARLLAALNNLGELSSAMHHLKEAKAYYDEAHAVAEEIGDPGMRAIVKVNLGRVCNLMGDNEQAEPYLHDGIELAKAASDSIAEAEGLTTLGNINAASGENELAEARHRESLALAEETGHPPGIIDALSNLGTLYLRTGKLDDAREVLERASGLGEEIGAPLSALPAYEQLAELYENNGRLELAIGIHKRISALQLSVSSEETARRMTAIRTGYELERSRAEAEIVRLRNVELRQKSSELEAANNQMQLIARIAREVTAALDVDQLTELLYARVSELMDASVFGIAIFDQSEQTLEYALYVEEAQRITPFVRSVDSEDSFAAWSVRNNQEIVLLDADREFRKYIPKRRSITSRHSKSLVFVPLSAEDHVVGVMTIQSHKKRAYSESQLELLRALAAFVAIALDNSRKHATIQELNAVVTREKVELEEAYKKIEHLANHDNLTELPNRRLLGELLAEHIPLARRQGRKFGILYIDLDDFKPINDRFGHASGDAALVRIGSRLESTVRESDTVARIGGDEFVLIVRDINGREDLETISRKVLESIAAPLEVGGEHCTLGASVGVSVYPDDGETSDALLEAADSAMYHVKAEGKRGVHFYRDGPERPGDHTADSSMTSSSNTN
jgi:diguanylate cyclase (GGDEF)-like protein